MKKCFYLLNLVVMCLLSSSLTATADPVDTVSALISVHVCSGNVGTLYITTNTTVTPIWVYSDDGGDSWQPTTDGDIYTGTYTDTLKVVTNTSINNRIYCCDLYLGPGMTNLLTEGAATVTADTTVVVSSITGGTNVCMGQMLTLSDATSGGVWSNFNTAVSTISTDGVVTGVASGIDTIWYTVTNACGSYSAWQNVMVDTLAMPSIITAPLGMCSGAMVTFTDSIAGGTWTNGAGAASVNASGIVTGLMQGTGNITYTIANSCGTNMVSATITVDTLPGAITCPAMLCDGFGATLSNTVPGGTWSNTQTAVDAVVANLITAVSTGADTVVYTLTNYCGTNMDSAYLTALTLPVVSPISGNAGICASGMDTLTDVTVGGTWANMYPAISTIDASGIVTPVAVGLDTISYAVTNFCGTTTVAYPIHVDPVVLPISGASSVCVGATVTLSDAVDGGVWSRLHAAKDSVGHLTGIVRGIASGLDTISYTLTNACGLNAAQYAITINTVPTVAAISGVALACAGTPITMTDATPGGTWSNHFAADDSISASGVVYSLRYGHDSIFYSVTNECGTTTKYKTIITDTLISAGMITGPTGVCVGATILLYRSISGGIWSHTDTLLDTLHGITYGIVTGRAAGLDTIMYTRTNECGSAMVWTTVQVDTLNAGTITGNSVFCGGTTDTMMASAPGGVWRSYSTAIATVDANGVVTGSLTGHGVDTIFYSVTNSCGTRTANMPIVVKPAPNPGMIYGGTHVCVGSSISLFDTAIHDTLSTGVWSHTNVFASSVAPYTKDSVKITASAAGIDTIMFTVTNACGSATSWRIIWIDTAHTATTVTGPANICIAQPIMFTGSPAGGMWFSSAKGFADSMGNITGTTAGSDTVVYVYMNACGTDTARTTTIVNALPNAGTITGMSAVCNGSMDTLADAVSGGVWSVSNASGTINAGGVFTSAMSGKDTIYYAVSNAHCTNKAMAVVRVDTVPSAYPITGPTSVCIGSVILMENMNTWGTHTWSLSNANATIASTGLLIGAVAGSVIVSYDFTNACGSDHETFNVTVQAPLVAGQLMGPAFVCQGSMITLTDTLADGIWLSGNPYIASVDGTDTYSAMITGRHVGTTVISYTFWNSCGAVTDTQTLHVYGEALPIGGLDSVGIGVYRNLTNTTPGGIWTSSAPSLATVDSTGKVYGLAAGVDTIYYTVNNPCGTSVAWILLHIGNKPSAGTIFGKDTVCAGLNIDLGDTAIAGGVWSAVNGSAVVNSFGVVTGVNGPALDTINYSVTNGFGTGKVSKKIYVNSVPVVRIHHYTLVAVGGQYPLLDTPATGTWWSSDYSSITFAGGKMIVLGYTHDTVNYNDTLIYTVTNLCGVTRDTLIYNLPNPNVKVANVPNPVSGLNVFPNPGNGNFNLMFTSEIEENAHVVLSNIMGQKVNEFTVSSNKLAEFVINQPDGVYLLSASTATARFDLKIVVSH